MTCKIGLWEWVERKGRKRWVEDVGKRGRRGRVRIEEILVLCNTITELKPRIRAR